VTATPNTHGTKAVTSDSQNNLVSFFQLWRLFMAHRNELLQRFWVVEYRDVGKLQPRQIDAWKMEGWSNDYAFFDSNDRVFLLIPRDIVASVGVVRTLEE